MKIRRPVISILTGSIAPAFFAPDAGGAGTAAPVIEVTPAAPAAKPEGDVDLMSFDAPNPDDVMRAISSTAKELEPVPLPPKKEEPAAPPKSPAKDAAKPAAGKKEGDEPVAKLRTEYEATKAKLADAEKRLAEGDPRLKQYEADVAAARKELQEERDRAKEAREKLVEYDANNDEEVLKLTSEWAKKRDNFDMRVATLDAAKVWSFASELATIPAGDRAKMRDLTEKVNAAIGGDADTRHPDLDKTLDFIEQTRDFGLARNQKIAEVKSKVEDYQVEKAAKHYTTVKSRVDGLIENGRKVPEGIAESNPTHPRLMIAKLEEHLGDNGKKILSGLQEVTRVALAGVRPRNSKDFQGMAPEEIQRAQLEDAQRVEKYRDIMAEEFQNFGMAYYAMPAILRELSRLRAKVGEDKISEPPDPSLNRGGDDGPKDDDDLSSFRAPDLDKVAI